MKKIKLVVLLSGLIVLSGCTIKTPKFEPQGSRNHNKCFKLNNCIIKTTKFGKSALSIKKDTAVVLSVVEEKLIELGGIETRVFDFLLTVSNRVDKPVNFELEMLEGYQKIKKQPSAKFERSAFPYKQSAVAFAVYTASSKVDTAGAKAGFSRKLDDQFHKYNLNLKKILAKKHEFADKKLKSALLNPKKTIAGRVLISEEGFSESVEENGSKKIVLKIPVDNDIHSFYLIKEPNRTHQVSSE